LKTDHFEAAVARELKTQVNGSAANANGRPKEESKKPEPLIITMDQIKAEKVDWLWTNRIPMGRLTLIDGDPAAGKSWLSLAVASEVSRGEALPFGRNPAGPANVLLMSCEDGYSDTVRPRLDQLGADVSRIAIPNPGRGLSTAMLNASFIEQAVKQLGPALVIIDPIIAFAGRKNTTQSDDVRQLLSPLMGLSERHAFACLIIRHFTKQVDVRAMYRGGGAVDFMAACRSAFIIVESEEEPGTRVMAQVKNSLGPKSPSLSFRIDSDGFHWGSEVDIDAEGLLAAHRTGSRDKEKGQLELAKRFLEETLSAGSSPSNKVKAKAQEAGISNATLWRAKDLLEIKASKERGTGEWWWRLP